MGIVKGIRIHTVDTYRSAVEHVERALLHGLSNGATVGTYLLLNYAGKTPVMKEIGSAIESKGANYLEQGLAHLVNNSENVATMVLSATGAITAGYIGKIFCEKAHRKAA